MEQIEVRGDGSMSAREADLDELGMWSPRERRLRRKGVVGWRAVNLLVGDVEGKRAVVQDWERMRESRNLYGDRENWILPTGLGLEYREDLTVVAGARADVIRDLETVGERKVRLMGAMARVAEWDREDAVLGFKKQEPSAEQVDETLEAARIGKERMLNHLTEREHNIAEQKRFWRLRIQAQSVHLHDAELKQNGLEAAMQAEGKWKTDETKVLQEVDIWLDLVLRERAEAVAEAVSSDHVEEKLSPETRQWLDILVPRIWHESVIRGSGR